MKKEKDTVKEDIEHGFGDKDRDGVINILDCDPNNPDKHGWFGDVYRGIKERVVKPVYHRITRPPREFVSGFKRGYREAGEKETHPLEDIRKGERIYHERIVTPVSTFIGGETARKKLQLQKDVELKGQNLDTANIAFDKKWSPLIQNNEFVGTGAQYNQYKSGYSRLETQYKEYETTLHNLETVGKPSPLRQVTRGAAELAASIPGFVVFGAPRILTETAIAPKQAPAKLAKFGSEYYEFGKKEPFRAAGQITAMALGAKALRKVGGKAYEPIKFFRKTKVPVEQIVKQDVISGVHRFPVSQKPPRKLIKTFEHSDYTRLAEIAAEEGSAIKVWHAAPYEFAKSGKVHIGGSELPGMYASPSLSPWFLRVTAKPKYKLLGLGLEEAPKPSALLVKVKGVERLPKGVREHGFRGSREFMLEKAEPGKGYITPKYERGWRYTPREEEAVIPAQTRLMRTDFSKFVEWEGKKIPIHEYAVEGLRGVSKDMRSFERAGAVSKRYGKEYERYGRYREPIVTPKGLARPAFLSEVIEEDMRRIPKEERAFTAFEKKEERISRPDRRRERRYAPREEERRILPPEERILESFEDPIKEFMPREPPFIPEEERIPPPERLFREPPYKPIKIIPFEKVPPIPKKKKKGKKRLKTTKEELDDVYRKRRYPTLTPAEMLRM